MKYNLSLPTSTEQVGGWTPGTRIEFVFENKGEEVVKKSIRLNGLLSLSKSISGATPVPVALTDKVILDPDAGMHGFIDQIVTTLGSSSAENIQNYGRFLKMKNEAKRYQIDACTDTHSMCELMTFSNDAYTNVADVKVKAYSGVLFPSSANAYEIPFSLNLDFCLNNSDENIPFSKLGQVKVSIILQQTLKTGLMALALPANTTFSYVLKNLEIRYMTEPEKQSYGGIILETKTSAHIPSVTNKYASLEFSATNALDSVVCSFIRNTSINNLDNKSYNFLQTEPLLEKLNTFEVKINGQNDVLQYPLKFQTAEILYNYLKAWKPYVMAYDDVSVDKHGLSYKKLAQAGVQQAGYGLGCAFHGGLDAGTKVQLNLNLNDVPASAYQAFIYSIGSLII